MSPLYGTIAYRMMLAANERRGWRTVWSNGQDELLWTRVNKLGCVCPILLAHGCPLHAEGLHNVLVKRLPYDPGLW
jgi:hypothetical protein